MSRERPGAANLALEESGALGFSDCDFLGLRLAAILFASVDDRRSASGGSPTKNGY